ncbi:hypothetical protein Rhopal_006992-T1 [Rhodotorula paludigena]|uniref:Protein kinase domain-containing protein n=1 Tax=Rhodotorula paludigena TaxID=86838 RepID=A0AAV5GUN6_9BASI|nr:hypothetical protein Rhopal_006992-T1 [Rhodotorula paludigena]
MSTQRPEGQPPERFDKIYYSDLSPESDWIRLGKGSFGCVYKGEYLGIEIAIKEVLPSKDYDVEKYLQREITLMQQARHPNIVQYLGLSFAPPLPDADSPQPRILIISEFLPRGNLRQYILDRTLPFPWRLRISFAVDTTRALAYLHARNTMHRDLKGENLLITSNERIKACDFGLARVAPGGGPEDEAWRRLTYCGTDGYMSPEVLNGLPFNLKTDIFSLGVLFVEIASRQLASNHTFVRGPPTYGISQSEAFVDLALQCCATDPRERPDTKEILRRLRDVEQEVLALEARGLGDADAHTRGALHTVRRKGSMAANVGSISFSGSTKRGSGKGYGAVNLQLGCSFVPPSTSPVEPTATVTSVSPSIPSTATFGHMAREPSLDSEYDDEDSEALLALAQADIPIDSLSMRPDFPSSISSALAREPGDDPENSTSVVKPSRILGSSAGAAPYGRLGSSSGSTLAGAEAGRGVGSLPSLPPSWVATARRVAIHDGEEGEDEGTKTVMATPPRTQSAATTTGHNSPDSYLTARTSTLSVANAVVGHARVVSLESARSVTEEEQDSGDVFHSTIQGPLLAVEEVEEKEAPHRFSLIKPGLQRFLGSLAPYSAASPSLAFSQGQRSSWDASGRMEVGLPAASSGAAGGRCGLCDKKFGIMKAYLSCDDCGFATAAPVSAPQAQQPPKPSRAPPSAPLSRSSSKGGSKERGAGASAGGGGAGVSKLVKKGRTPSAGGSGGKGGKPLAAANA